MSPQRAKNRLREIMDRQGYSMIRLSRAGVSVTTISSIINGDHFPGDEIRELLAKELKVSQGEIWPEPSVPVS